MAKILILIGGLVVGCLGLYIGFHCQAFLWSCVTTTGKASSKPVEHKNNGHHSGTKYSFHYTFTVDGKSYEGWTDEADDPSEIVTVYYDRSNPANNRIDEPNPTIGWGLAGLGFALSMFAIYGYYREKQRAA